MRFLRNPAIPRRWLLHRILHRYCTGFRTAFFNAPNGSVKVGLASRAIPVMMFRSPPDSEKPRRRMDESPEEWRRLRDDLHALALEHGDTWLRLAKFESACQNINGRNYELWQPILAIASWIDECGGEGLLESLQQYALESIEAACEDSIAFVDEVLLRVLAEAVVAGDTPKASQVLERARIVEGNLFKNWTARGVSEHLKRYGLVTHKSNGTPLYNRVTEGQLRQIADSYNLDLGFSSF